MKRESQNRHKHFLPQYCDSVIMQALILAGGYGKRLRPYTENIPKPLIPIKGKPILEYQLNWLINQGIKNYVFLVGYKADKIIEYFSDGSKWGVDIEYSVEDEPLGTAGAIKNASRYIDGEVFLVLNGDIITDLRILPLIEALSTYKASIALIPMPSPYGIVETDEEGVITRFREKPILDDKWINGGVYAMRREILRILPDKGDIEKMVFPHLAEEKLMRGIKYQGVFWRSIDTVKDLEYMEDKVGRYREYFVGR